MYGNGYNGNGGGNMGAPGQFSSGVPHSGPVPGNHGVLQPWNHQRAIAGGAQWAMVNTYPPALQVVEGCRYQYVTRSSVVSTVAAMTSPTTDQFRQFNPGVVLAITAGGYKTDGTDLPVGRGPLDCFKVRLYFTAGTTTSINVTTTGTNPVLASTLFGNGALPAYMPLNGLRVEQGWQLSLDLQILVANFEATVTIHLSEEYPPGA